MNAQGKTAFLIVGIAMTVFIATASMYYITYFGTEMPFKNIFSYDMETVTIATTFENMRSSMINIKNNVVTAIPGDPATLYNTIYPWAKTPDNTLRMNNRAIDLCIERLDLSIAYYQTYRQNASASLVNDWYTTTITNIKTDWVKTYTFDSIKAAYVIQKAGVLGDLSLNIFPLIANVFLIIALGAFLFGILSEDLDSKYEIKYTRDDVTHVYTVHAWTKWGASRLFNDGNTENKIISITEIE